MEFHLREFVINIIKLQMSALKHFFSYLFCFFFQFQIENINICFRFNAIYSQDFLFAHDYKMLIITNKYVLCIPFDKSIAIFSNKNTSNCLFTNSGLHQHKYLCHFDLPT